MLSSDEGTSNSSYQSEEMYKCVPPVQDSGACGNMTARHGDSEDTLENSLFDDIQDLLDIVGNVGQTVELSVDPFYPFEDYQLLGTDHESITGIEDMKSTINPKTAIDIDIGIPNITELVDEVFKETQMEKERKETNKHLLEPYDIQIGDKENSQLVDTENKQIENLHRDVCYNFENLNDNLETPSFPLKQTVIVYEKCKNSKGTNGKPQNTEDQTSSVDLCPICEAPAGKHTYYGGKSCGPCRAFFRRSVQSKYFDIFQCKIGGKCKINADSRKKCQFCRFQKCLESGMKTAWVLSEEERNKRFNKLTKLKRQNSSPDYNECLSPQPLGIPELYMKFTIEEKKTIEDLHQRFKFHQQMWLKNLFLLHKDAGLNVLEAMFKITPIKIEHFKYLEDIFHLSFTQTVVPKLLENADLPTKDIGQLINGQSSAISHMFKMHQFTKMDQTENDRKTGNDCSISKQVSDLVENNEMNNIEYIGDLFSKLEVGQGLSMPTYDDLYPKHWANDKEVEDRHKEISRKIQRWPTDDKDKFDYSLVLLLVVILLFNPDYNPMLTRSVVTTLQSKYVTLLQRYIRSKLDVEGANKKFLEAMMLLSFARELWDLSRRHQKM